MQANAARNEGEGQRSLLPNDGKTPFLIIYEACRWPRDGESGTWIGATGLWVEMKTISSTPYVPNKDGYLTDVLHSLGSSFVVGKGLHLPPGGEMCTKVMPF